jgi:hypothetical protein
VEQNLATEEVAPAIVGSFRWIPPEDGGRLYPPERGRMAANVRLEGADGTADEHCLVIDGIAGDQESEVRAAWQDPGRAPSVAPGDVLTIEGGHRPIATLEVTSVS